MPSTKLTMLDGKALAMEGQDNPFEMSNLAHQQIGQRLGIPRDYYKKMQEEAPDLLSDNVNRWLHTKPERRLVRVLDNRVRAVLSDKYQPKENYAVASVLFPVLKNAGNVQIHSSNLSPANMFIKVISHELEGEVKLNDVVKGGIAISNSEVGCGAFSVNLFFMRLVCMNGMIREHSMRARHVGKRIDFDNEEEINFYSRETIAAEQRAFMLKVQDVVTHAFDKEKFREELARFRHAAENPMDQRRISEAVENVTKRFSLTQEEGKGMLGHLVADGELSQWGLSQAATRLARDIEDYDRSTELERIGGKIIDLETSDWRAIAG